MKRLIVEWILPIRTVSEANIREHHFARSRKKRRQVQKYWVDWVFATGPKQELPEKIHVVLTRIASRKMDYDNLVSSFKNIRDYIAACVHPVAIVIARSKSGKLYENPGHCDKGDSITWDYKQEKGKPKEYAVKIQIFEKMIIHDPRND